ncbi:MAG TPA: hypothetical protein VJT49_14945 [Amycolatopsis sp.]|uniref:hypothetical protein n=1 Tax=Amycolatopsis sp. TaxID=37632 RepID=UPI002B47A16F|nr:hypothetical protein [Amycolatopsis sp.]HKS46376.1 hypothetical protein [Amycolatopsis sp.]
MSRPAADAEAATFDALRAELDALIVVLRRIDDVLTDEIRVLTARRGTVRPATPGAVETGAECGIRYKNLGTGEVRRCTKPAEHRDRCDGPVVERQLRPRLVKVDPMHTGGEVTYRVEVDGRAVGWVGDGRPWRGHRFGGRRWFACWREDGDTAARWDSGLEYGARSAALAALLAEVAR